MTFKAICSIVFGSLWDVTLVVGVATFVQIVLVPWRMLTGAL